MSIQILTEYSNSANFQVENFNRRNYDKILRTLLMFIPEVYILKKDRDDVIADLYVDCIVVGDAKWKLCEIQYYKTNDKINEIPYIIHFGSDELKQDLFNVIYNNVYHTEESIITKIYKFKHFEFFNHLKKLKNDYEMDTDIAKLMGKNKKALKQVLPLLENKYNVKFDITYVDKNDKDGIFKEEEQPNSKIINKPICEKQQTKQSNKAFYQKKQDEKERAKRVQEIEKLKVVLERQKKQKKQQQQQKAKKM